MAGQGSYESTDSAIYQLLPIVQTLVCFSGGQTNHPIMEMTDETIAEDNDVIIWLKSTMFMITNRPISFSSVSQRPFIMP